MNEIPPDNFPNGFIPDADVYVYLTVDGVETLYKKNEIPVANASAIWDASSLGKSFAGQPKRRAKISSRPTAAPESP